MLNYHIIDPFPVRGTPYERDDAPKSLNEIQQEELAKRTRERSSGLVHSLLSILK